METPQQPEPAEPAATLPKDWDRTVYNLLYRVLGHRKTAKKLARKLVEMDPSPDCPVTIQARELAKLELPSEDYGRTMFCRGREILTEPLDPEDLPHLGPGFDVAGLEKEVKDALSREHLITLELLFVDRRPVSEVAELFSVSQGLIQTFVSRVIDLLGEITQVSHDSGGDCTHPLQLIRARIDRHFARSASNGHGPRKDEALPSCQGCQDSIALIDDILELLSRDSRILSLGDDRLIKRAIEGPRVKVSEPPSPLAPPPRPDRPPTADLESPPPLPEPNPMAWKVTGGLAALLVFYSAFSMFSGMGGSEGDGSSFKKGLKTLKQDSIGTYSDLTAPAKELIAHSTISASSRSPLYLTFHSGVQVEVMAGSQVTVTANRVKLNRGRLHVKITEGPPGGFFVAVSDLVGRLREGDLLAAFVDTTPIRFSLKAGVLDVKDAKGRRYRLEPANVMKTAGAGLAYSVEESTADDLASIEPKESSGSQSGPGDEPSAQ